MESLHTRVLPIAEALCSTDAHLRWEEEQVHWAPEDSLQLRSGVHQNPFFCGSLNALGCQRGALLATLLTAHGYSLEVEGGIQQGNILLQKKTT